MDLSNAIPAALTFDAVITEIAAFLSNPLVLGAVVATVALGFAVRVARAVKRAGAGR